MATEYEPVSPAVTLGALVTGIEVHAIDDSAFEQFARRLADHGVLVVPDQHLTREEHIALAERFGAIDEFDTRTPNVTSTPWVARPAGARVVVETSNVDAEGHRSTPAGSLAWRSDGSFKPRPVTMSLVCAVRIDEPTLVTEFADLAAAYDVLPEGERHDVAQLAAWHSAVYVRAAAGTVAVDVPTDPRDLPGALHPLVRTHPLTGRQALFLGENACAIPGIDRIEAAARLRTLLDDAGRPPRVYAHRWRAGDLVVWDVRRVVHRTPTWEVDAPATLRHISVIADSPG